jgi:hypothetical protein
MKKCTPFPFVLSLSKNASAALAWFDKLTTNGTWE